MTRYSLSKNNGKIKISVKGHSKAGIVNGVDMCCLGVSMLSHTLKDYLDSLCLDNYITVFKEGLLEIEFSSASKRLNKALGCIDVITCGFKLLKETYPLNITMKGDLYE